jgi:hypothetical protein
MFDYRRVAHIDYNPTDTPVHYSQWVLEQNGTFSEWDIGIASMALQLPQGSVIFCMSQTQQSGYSWYYSTLMIED